MLNQRRRGNNMKLQLTKEQDKAIRKLKTKKSNEQIIKDWMQANGNTEVKKYTCLNLLSFDDFILSLYGEYEIKTPPEESILSEYNRAIADMNSGDYDLKFTGEATADAINFVLNELGKKIKGINA
jgi:hypothetical protein